MWLLACTAREEDGKPTTDTDVADLPAELPQDSGAVDSLPPETGDGATVPTGTASIAPVTDTSTWLVQALTVDADVPVSVSMVLAGAEGTRVVDFHEVSTHHRLPVLGLRALSHYDVDVVLRGAGGDLEITGLAIDSGGLPADFPILDVLTHDPAGVGPGPLAFDVASTLPNTHIVVLDEGLEPIWVRGYLYSAFDARTDAEGTWWIVGARGGIVHLDWLGTVLHQWGGDPIPGAPHVPLGLEELHHEVVPDGVGGWWALSSVAQAVPAYPTDYDAPYALGGPVTIRDPSAVHVAADGSVLADWPLSPRLLDTRISFDALDLTEGVYLDWGHGNSLCLDPVDGSVTVGLRHQDVVVHLDPAGNLEWILGEPNGWPVEFDAFVLRPTPGTNPSYHVHGACFDADGVLVLFDNGNNGHTPYTEEPYPGWQRRSRAVGYAVDPAAGTFTELWSYTSTTTGDVYASARGDADLLANGNVLADFGTVDSENGLDYGDDLGWGNFGARIVEWAPDRPDAPVLDLRVRSDAAVEAGGWTVYRAERLASLYPLDGPFRATMSFTPGP